MVVVVSLLIGIEILLTRDAAVEVLVGGLDRAAQGLNFEAVQLAGSWRKNILGLLHLDQAASAPDRTDQELH